MSDVAPQTVKPQHAVFSHFKSWAGEVPPFWHLDFLGTRIRDEYIAGFGAGRADSHWVTDLHPPRDEEYFEWIDLLEAVVAARNSFTMIDLGAGYGRWAVRAAFAVKQYHGDLPFRLFAVEAEPTVYGWLNRHFADNGLDPARHSLIHGAISGKAGDALFIIGGPRGGPYDRDPNGWYGQCLTKDHDVSSGSRPDGEYRGYNVMLHKSGWRSIRIPAVSLRDILNKLDRVDLIDMDIEGEELPAVRSTIAQLDAQVKRLHIGTHGKEIESGLRQVLSSHGWRNCADYSLFSTSETPWGTISFENGVQSWVNPRLAP